MTRDPIRIENDRLVIRSLKKEDLKGLEALRCDQRVYCYEPTFLMELQGTPEEALETLQNMDLYEDRQCILGVYEKTTPCRTYFCYLMKQEISVVSGLLFCYTDFAFWNA